MSSETDLRTPENVTNLNDLILKDQPKELLDILDEVALPENQGEPFKGKDYFYLFLCGLIIPAILMIVGWVL